MIDIEDEFDEVVDEKVRYSAEEYNEWHAHKIGFFDGYRKANSSLRKLYKIWCKETKRNGAILIGGSIQEFFDWLTK